MNVEPIVMDSSSYHKLEKNILMFYIGGTHDASAILKEQGKNVSSSQGLHDKIEAQKKMCDLTWELKERLQENDVDAMGELLHQNWMLKKSLASGISNPVIDDVYSRAVNAGAMGGKLLGAGGAGFMIFYVPTDVARKNVRRALSDLRELDFEMDNSGASIVFVDKDFG